jgi:hypothetical protein
MEKSLKRSSQFYKKLFERQPAHLAGLFVLLAVIWFAGESIPYSEGELWGVSSKTWFWASIMAAIIHQVYTWLMWRIELYGKVLSNRIGEKSFSLFRVFFSLFGLSRFLVIPLAFSNRGTLHLPDVIQWGLSGTLVLLSIYLFYSVFRWFGIKRAAGLDHFKPEEAVSWGFVKEGIFRFTSNGMYIFGFLILWVPGLMLESAGALLAAAFSHLYIWVHYYCTEKPDMEFIYSKE